MYSSKRFRVYQRYEWRFFEFLSSFVKFRGDLPLVQILKKYDVNEIFEKSISVTVRMCDTRTEASLKIVSIKDTIYVNFNTSTASVTVVSKEQRLFTARSEAYVKYLPTLVYVFNWTQRSAVLRFGWKLYYYFHRIHFNFNQFCILFLCISNYYVH